MIVDSIYFKGHTCFKNEWAGFDTIKPINVIIGRNNSGKSHLLDLVEALCMGGFKRRGWQYRCSGTLDEASLQDEFSSYIGSGELGGTNDWRDHGRHFVDAGVAWETGKSGDILELKFLDGFKPRTSFGDRSTRARIDRIKNIVSKRTHRLTGRVFRRLVADRDIATESSTKKLSLARNGRGATNIVRRYIVVVCDSDRSSKNSGLKDRVRRIREEVNKTPAGHPWVTRAREIENYIPGVVLNRALTESSLPDPKQFESFFPRKRCRHKSYIEKNLSREQLGKMDLAMSSVPHMTRELMESRFDWNEQMAQIVERIESWNG